MKFDFLYTSPERTSNEVIHPIIEHAYVHAEKILRESAIDMNEFVGFYNEKKLAQHFAIVEKKEKNFSYEPHNVYSEVLEAIIYDQIQNGPWFGENTKAIKTSRYDDYENGSDIILELQDTAKGLYNLSLSIDVTFGTTTETKKFLKIKENIDNGTLGEISYFKSARANFRGEISQVPQVVIGIEKDLLVKLADLWANDGPHKEKNKEEINRHPAQRVIMAEILLQLHTFRTYAKNIGQESLVPVYEKDIQILEEIMREQGIMDIGELRNDKVFTAIREALSMFKIEK